MGDQPGAGGSHSFKIRGHSRQRRSTKPYSRPSDRKKGVLETVKDFFSPSWLVDFWKGKIAPEEEEVEQDEDIEEPEYPTDTIETEQGPSRGSLELMNVNTRLAGQTSSDTRERIDKVYGNGGLGSVASAQITSQTSRKSGLTAFLALTSRQKSNKESVVTRTTGSSSKSTESSRPVVQERFKAPRSTSDHIKPTEGESPSSSHNLPTRAVSTPKDSESPSTSFLNPGPSRKALPSLISTSTPMPEPSISTPMDQSSTASERIPLSIGSRPQPMSVFRNRPEFSVAAFGSPLPPRQNTQTKQFSSPFYSGKTAFGGASSQLTSSSKRMRVSSPGSLEISRPVKKQMKPTPIAGPGAGGVASQTAKRILETLEKMSSPLVDAKKIPPSPPFSASSSPLSFSQSMRRKHPYQPNRTVGSPRKLQARFGAPPVQSLSVPQRASISRIHQKPPSTRTAIITSQAQEPTSFGHLSSRDISKPTPTFTPTPLPMSLSPKESLKAGGKMRTAKTSNTHYKSQTITEDEEEVVNPLPEIVSAVPLSIPSSTTLPTFSFSPSSTSNKMSTSTSSTTKMGFSFAPPKSKESDITTNNFKFSIPEPKASSTIASTSDQTPEKKSSYLFSRPAPVSKSDSSTMSDDGKNNTTKSLLDKYKPAEGSWECTTCMINNKATSTSCIACSSSKPDKTVVLPSNDLFKKFAPPTGSWTCETCMIINKSTDDKCVACQTPKPSSSKSASQSDDLRKKFAPAEDSWECSSCMLNNKGSDSKCIACEAPKPSLSKSAATPRVLQSDDLRKKFAPAEDSWECSSCMLNNKGSDSKCIACQTPKPSSSKKSSIPTTSTSDDLMKKFAPANNSWECSTCMINNKSSDNKCVACETPKPGVESSSSTSSSKLAFGTATSFASKFAPVSGSWTCDTCMIVNKSDALKCLACETPKPGSSSTGAFSLASENNAVTKTSFTGGASTGPSTKTTFQFGATSSESDSPSSSVPFKFGTNAVTTTTQPFTFGGPSESKKSDSSNISSFVFGKSVASTDTNASDSTIPSFTFGASTTASKPTIQFGVTADSKPSDSSQKAPPAIESGLNNTSGDSQQKIQFGGPSKTDGKKALPFIFGGSTPAIQFGSGSIVQESAPKASETPPKRKQPSIADAAAAGLLKIPSSLPAPVVDLTGEDDSNTDQDKVNAPPNVNLFQSFTQPNQMFSTAATTAVATKSETTGSTALPSLQFAFGATSASKPADEPLKAVPPLSFMAGASNTPVTTDAAPTATASPFNFVSPLGSENKALSNPTASSLVTPQFGSFPPPVSTTMTGFPSLLDPPTTSTGTSTFAFKATTNTNGKFGAPDAASGFAFCTPLSNAAGGSSSGAGGFAFGGASAAPSAGNATSAPFVFGGQSSSEPKAGFNFAAPNQPFAFGASTSATQNTQVTTTSQVPESMDADGNNNSSQPTVPAFGSQAAPSVTPFNFNAEPATNTGFNFGSAQPASAFKFGASQAPSLAGSTPSGPSVPAFGAPAPTLPAASGGFNFGSPAPNNLSSVQPSSFIAGSGSGAFSAGTGGGQTKRIIKKGIRRMKR